MESIANVDESHARLAKIRQAILRRFPKSKSPKYALLKQALQDAEYYHASQVRKSGEPAIIHPYRVALLVSEANMGVEAVIIALLHDVIEDTEFTKGEVSAKYGEWLAEAVDGLTKVAAKSADARGRPASIETYRKLLHSSVRDLRTLQVKIFDRLDNMRDLGFLERPRQRRIAMETMQVYVPMAQRLGLGDIANELATLCFRYLYPKRFNKVLSGLKQRIAEEGQKVKGIKRVLESTLRMEGGRSYRVEPTYRHVADYVFEDRPVRRALSGFTICVPTTEDCYTAMGRLHMRYRVVPNSIRDFISNPKPNRHQGLESKVFVGGEPITITVLSEAMAAVVHSGILADWKSSHEELSRYYQSYLELLDQFAENEDLRMEDVLRYGQMDSLQIFTPIGEVLTFPQMATILDFAFAIHTDLGVHCDGALVDGRRARRFDELRDGTMVEVVTDPDVQPDAKWLAHVRTTRAKLALRRYIRGQKLSRAVDVGRKLFNGALKRMEINAERFYARKSFLRALEGRKLTLEQFFQQVGTRQLHIRAFLEEHRLASERELALLERPTRSGLLRYLKPGPKRPDPDLKIPEFGDEFILLAACCSPLLGDRIVGVQQEQGILIHRAECSALENADLDALVSVGWETDARKVPYQIRVRVKDRPGQIYKIGKIMRDLKVNIEDLGVEPLDTQGVASIRIRVEPITVQTYQKIVSRLRNIKEVLAIS